MTQKNVHYFMKSLITINVIIIVAANFLTPLWAAFVHKIGGDLRTAGNALLVFGIVIGVLTCIAGKIENYLNRDKWFLVITQAMFVAGYIFYFWIQHPWQLYLAETWLGVAGAFQSPAICSLYQQFMPAGQRTAAWGVWNGFYNIGLGVGAFISAYVAHAYGFNGVFTVVSLIAFVGLLIAIYVAKKIPDSFVEAA